MNHVISKITFVFSLAMPMLSVGQVIDTLDNGGTLEIHDKIPIDQKRYEGIKRSPYLYKEFVTGRVFDSREKYWIPIRLNYNGFSGEFEFMHRGQATELNDNHYSKIVMVSQAFNPAYSPRYMSDSTVFLKGVHPKSEDRFFAEVVAGPYWAILKSFEIDLINRKIEDVGKTLELNSFAPRFRYYLVRNGKVTDLKLTRKSLLNFVGDRQQVIDYMKKEKIKGDKEVDWVRVLTLPRTE